MGIGRVRVGASPMSLRESVGVVGALHSVVWPLSISVFGSWSKEVVLYRGQGCFVPCTYSASARQSVFRSAF